MIVTGANQGIGAAVARMLAGRGCAVQPPVTDPGWITDSVRRHVAGSGTHLATPDDVAEIVGFLVSDASTLVNGKALILR